MMQCGYVENASVSWLIFSLPWRKEGFATKEEAIRELALDLYSSYIEDKTPYTPRGEAKEEIVFDNVEFMEFVANRHYQTTDSYGDAEYANGRNLVWWPYWADRMLSAPREEILLIQEEAEVELLNALYLVMPELKKEKDHV
jgi:hypothetical protein